MKYQLASRMAGMKASAVREILKVTQHTDLAADDFIDILDALALVRLGRSLAADLCGKLSDFLLRCV